MLWLRGLRSVALCIAHEGSEAVTTASRDLLGSCFNQAPHDMQVAHSDEEWHRLLEPASYRILRQAGTEMPFSSPLERVRTCNTPPVLSITVHIKTCTAQSHKEYGSSKVQQQCLWQGGAQE